MTIQDLHNLKRDVKHAVEIYGEQEISNTFCRYMTQQNRDEFDEILVEIGHPLAFEAGTQEYRFKKFILSEW